MEASGGSKFVANFKLDYQSSEFSDFGLLKQIGTTDEYMITSLRQQALCISLRK